MKVKLKIKLISAVRNKLVDDINYIVYNYFDETSADKLFKTAQQLCIDLNIILNIILNENNKYMLLQKFKTLLVEEICKNKGFSCKVEFDNIINTEVKAL